MVGVHGARVAFLLGGSAVGATVRCAASPCAVRGATTPFCRIRFGALYANDSCAACSDR
jgi:hypothetical protein